MSESKSTGSPAPLGERNERDEIIDVYGRLNGPLARKYLATSLRELLEKILTKRTDVVVMDGELYRYGIYACFALRVNSVLLPDGPWEYKCRPKAETLPDALRTLQGVMIAKDWKFVAEETKVDPEDYDHRFRFWLERQRPTIQIQRQVVALREDELTTLRSQIAELRHRKMLLEGIISRERGILSRLP